jgi:hypothetical protein
MSYRPNWGKPALLSGVLLAAGLIAIWLEYRVRPERERSEELSKRVFGFKKEEAVESITLIDGDRKFVFSCLDLEKKLCRSGDQSIWELEAPKKFATDKSNVNSLVSTLANLTAPDTLDLSTETQEKRQALLKDYSLDQAATSGVSRKSIEIKLSGGKRITAFIGNTHPIGGRLFVMIERDGVRDEQKIWLAPTSIKTPLDNTLTYWRNKNLLQHLPPLASHEVGSFELRGPKGQVLGVRKDGNWSIQERKGDKLGEELRGDFDAIDAMTNSAIYLQAKDFSTESLSGLKPVVSFVLRRERSGDEKNPAPGAELEFFEKKTKNATRLFARVSGTEQIFEMDPNSKDRFNNSAGDLRFAKLLTTVDRFSAKKIKISSPQWGKPALEATLKDNQWSAPDSALNSENVQNILDRLTSVRAQDFIKASQAPAGENTGLTLELLDGEKSVAKFVFWRVAQDLYARDLRSARSEVLKMDKSLADLLPFKRDGLETKPPEAQRSSHDGHRH